MAAGTALAAMEKRALGMGAAGMAQARPRGKAQRLKSLESRVDALEGTNSGTEAEAPAAPIAAAAPADTAPIAGGFSPGAINAASGVFGTEEERQASIAPKPQILEEQEESASAQLGGLFADNMSYPGVGL
jgi:hypothetical protein